MKDGTSVVLAALRLDALTGTFGVDTPHARFIDFPIEDKDI